MNRVYNHTPACIIGKSEQSLYNVVGRDTITMYDVTTVDGVVHNIGQPYVRDGQGFVREVPVGSQGYVDELTATGYQLKFTLNK